MFQVSFQLGLRVFEKNLKKIQGGFKCLLRVFHESFKGFPKKFLGCFKEV